MSADSERDPAGLSRPQAGIRLPSTLRLGAWTIDTVGGVLQSQDKRVRLSRRANQVLCVLLRNPQVTVSRVMLMDEVWRGAEIGDEVITKAIREIRLAFGDETRERIIATVPRTGYRLMLSPERMEHAPSELTEPAEYNAHTAVSSTRVDANAVGGPGQRHAQATARALMFAFVILVALAVLFAAWLWRSPPGVDEALVAALTQHARPVAASASVELFPDLSPDGQRVAYSSRVVDTQRPKIYFGNIDSIERQRLTRDEEAHEYAPVWDPSGTRIAYQRLTDKRCDYMVSDLDGKNVQRVAQCGLSISPPQFSRDGLALLVVQPDENDSASPMKLVRVDLATGARRVVDLAKGLPHAMSVSEARMAPNERWAAYVSGPTPFAELYVTPIGDSNAGTRRVQGLPGALHGFAWLSDSESLLVSASGLRGTTLWRVPIAAPSTPALLGVFEFTRPRIADDAHRAVFEHRASREAVFRIDLAAQVEGSRLTRVLASSFSEYFPSLSPDERAVAFVSDRTGSPHVFVADALYGDVRQVTRTDSDAIGRPRWNMDGDLIGYARRVGERWTVVLSGRDGRTRREIAGDWEAVHQVEFSGDGQWIYFDARVEGAWRVLRSAMAEESTAQSVALGAHTPTRVPGDERLIVLLGDRGEFAWLSPEGSVQPMPSACPSLWNRQAWAVTESALYCVFGTAREDFALYRQSWAANGLERMATLPRGFPLLGLSVAEDASYALLGKGVIGSDANVVVVDLPR
jgi:Tol biopolymer transport system component/DNA-binding winged helix-turn-helix (wHTH) protein